MEQKGFRADPEHDQFYRGATMGWANFLGRLEQVLGRP